MMFGGTSGYELTEMVAYDPLKNRWINLPAPPENIVKASITSYNGSIFVTGIKVQSQTSFPTRYPTDKLFTWYVVNEEHK